MVSIILYWSTIYKTKDTMTYIYGPDHNVCMQLPPLFFSSSLPSLSFCQHFKKCVIL